MRQDTLFLLLYLAAIGALLITQLPRNETKPVTIEDKVPVAAPDKAPVADKPSDALPPGGASVGKGGLTPDCEKELRRTADLLRFFANRIQMGEEAQSVIADMRQQDKRISTACD